MTAVLGHRPLVTTAMVLIRRGVTIMMASPAHSVLPPPALPPPGRAWAPPGRAWAKVGTFPTVDTAAAAAEVMAVCPQNGTRRRSVVMRIPTRMLVVASCRLYATRPCPRMMTGHTVIVTAWGGRRLVMAPAGVACPLVMAPAGVARPLVMAPAGVARPLVMA